MSEDVTAIPSPSPILDKKGRDKTEKKKRKREAAEERAQTGTSPAKKSRSHDRSKKTADSSTEHSETSNSPFFVTRASLYLPLAPVSHFHPLQGICADALSKLILTYYPPFRGIILSYSNVKLSPQPEQSPDEKISSPVLAKTIDEFAASFIWATADFLLLKAQRGATIEGRINLQNESHIGLVCWNLFNASIERKRLPKGWKWTGPDLGKKGKRKLKKAAEPAGSDEDEDVQPETADYSQDHDDHFVDEEGNKVEGYLQFRIKDIDTSSSADKERAFVSIEGTMLLPDQESELLEEESLRVKSKSRSRHINGTDTVMSGAQPNGAEEVGRHASATPKPRHRLNY